MKEQYICKKCKKPLPGPNTKEHQHIVSQCEVKMCPYKGNLKKEKKNA